MSDQPPPPPPPPPPDTSPLTDAPSEASLDTDPIQPDVGGGIDEPPTRDEAPSDESTKSLSTAEGGGLDEPSPLDERDTQAGPSPEDGAGWEGGGIDEPPSVEDEPSPPLKEGQGSASEDAVTPDSEGARSELADSGHEVEPTPQGSSEFGGYRQDVAESRPDLYQATDKPGPSVDGPHESPERWASDINPESGKVNCGDCARSVEQTWEGDPKAAAIGGPEHTDVMIDWAGADPESTTVEQIGDRLQDLGPGSSAIVRCDWDTGGGHYLNAVNDQGSVKAVDGQAGVTGAWPPSGADMPYNQSNMRNVEAIYFDSEGKVVR